jgi:hypothetical protein
VFLSDSCAGSSAALPRSRKVTATSELGGDLAAQEKEKRVNLTRKAVVATAMAGSMLGGGAVGVAVFGAGSGSAQTTGSSTTAPAATNGAPGGTFKPNEDATHEKGESAQREAQEDAGQRPTVP